MQSDAIFRIASMTKPITSLAIMMLAEEGRMSIVDPVAKYLPEFRDLKVAVTRPGADGKPATTLEPVRVPMTVQDLLRHTSGLTYGFTGAHPVKQAYVEAKVGDPNDTNATLVTKLSKLPLMWQPGTTWEYSVSTDVLGRIVEVVSGQTLDRFVAERITGPLRMPDTGFSAPASRSSTTTTQNSSWRSPGRGPGCGTRAGSSPGSRRAAPTPPERSVGCVVVWTSPGGSATSGSTGRPSSWRSPPAGRSPGSVWDWLGPAGATGCSACASTAPGSGPPRWSTS